VLFPIDLSTQRVETAGLAKLANELWMSQMERNLSDAEAGFLVGKRYLIHDQDPSFTAEFLETFGSSGVKCVKLPPRSPNLNAHTERFVRTIKESCLERMILFREGSLRKVVHEFVVQNPSPREWLVYSGLSPTCSIGFFGQEQAWLPHCLKAPIRRSISKQIESFWGAKQCSRIYQKKDVQESALECRSGPG